MKEAQFDQAGSLLKKTVELLRSDERTLIQIFSQTEIPYYWLKKFSAGEFKNPSVNRIQFLYEFLTNTKVIKE